METSALACPLEDLPRPSATQIALVAWLLPRLGEAMLSCTAAFKQECDDLGILSDLARPDVWIPSDEETDGDSCWSLVVERASDLEDGYHIECDGVTVVDMFAYGDLR